MNRKIDLVIIPLIMFSIIFTIITVTYSWYVRQTTGTVTNITMTSSDSDGIQLSADAENWAENLTVGESSGQINLDEDILATSVSTSGIVADGQMHFFGLGLEGSDYNTYVVEDPLYYTFDFYVRNNDDLYKSLNLGLASMVTDLDNKELSLSTRVAFINLGSTETQQQAQELDGQGINSLDYIWEPNSTQRSENISRYRNEYIERGKAPYNGVTSEFGSVSLENGVVINDTETQYDEVLPVETHDPIGSGDSDEITTLPSYSINKIRVYIWAEGQDIDNDNSISGGTAQIDLSFNTYDLVEEGGHKIPNEIFSTPNMNNNEGVLYEWEHVGTNISPSRIPDKYLIRILQEVNGEIIVIETIEVQDDFVNLDEKSLGLEFAENYFVEIKAYSEGVAASDFSNRLAFEILPAPSNIQLSGDVLSWDTVNYADSYTVKATKVVTGDEYFATIGLLSLNLVEAIFNDTSTLDEGFDYIISVKATGQTGYAQSEYEDYGIWSN